MSTWTSAYEGIRDEMPVAQRRGWLTGIVLVAFGLRTYNVAWGLPRYIFNDTRIYFVEAAQNAVGNGNWTLDKFTHPPFYPYLLSVATWVWATVSGDPVAMRGDEAVADRATIALIGRLITVAVAVMLVIATYLLGRRLLGTRTGLWAAAFIAIAPLQVLESHRVNVDTPMMLFAVLSAHQAVIAFQERRKDRLLLSFGLAAFAGATKYSGLFIGTLPLWVTLRWPDSSWRERFRMTVRGGIVSLAVYLLAMSPALLNWETFGHQIYQLFYIGIFEGAPGRDLTGDSWVFAPYLYMTFVGLPFMLGWFIFPAAVAGIVTTAVTDRRALALIAAGALPFYLLQGNAETAVARYYFPLLPFLTITAGAFVAWLRRASPKVGTVVAAAIVLYTSLLAVSQVSRIGGAPQAAIGEKLQRLAIAKRTTGISLRAIDQPKLMIAYPFWSAFIYDSLSPYIRRGPTRHLVYFPRFLRTPGDAIDPAQALRDDRRWIESNGIDVVIVTSRWENLRARKSFYGREEQFYQHLTQGRLGLRLVAHEETTYFTQSWYESVDPTLDTLWTTGIGGYKLFVRDDLVPALSMQLE